MKPIKKKQELLNAIESMRKSIAEDAVEFEFSYESSNGSHHKMVVKWRNPVTVGGK